MEAKEFLDKETPDHIDESGDYFRGDSVLILLEKFARQESKEFTEHIIRKKYDLPLLWHHPSINKNIIDNLDDLFNKWKKITKPLPAMYDHFMYEGREWMVWSINYPQNTHVEGRAVKIDGKQQTVRAKIDDCEWLLKKRKQ